VRVLVTGASSLLGAETARRLLARGNEVRVFQRRPSGLDVQELLGDVGNPAATEDAVRDVDGVVHLAAKVGIVGTWPEYERTNVRGTTNLIAAARDSGVTRFVYVSSPSVTHSGASLMGATAGTAAPDATRGDYARSKALAELAALAADREAFSVVAIRPHLVWGPGDTQFVGRIIDRAQRGRLAVIGSGAALIDTTYIDNAADALVAAVERAPQIGGRAFVVSNGQPRPVREIFNRIMAAAGLEPIRRTIPATLARTGASAVEQAWTRSGRADEPPITRFVAEQLSTAHWFDQRETRRSLEWAPSVSLDEGFARLREWFGQGVVDPD